jgi:acyl transferase domain-containing protein
VVFPGEPADRTLSAPTTWLTDPLVADASACAGSDIRRALTGRTVMGAAVVQPALVALQLAGWRRLLGCGVRPVLVTGQGAGEIAAWAASGAIEDHEALRLAALRGAAVELAALVHPTTRRSSPGAWNAIAMAPAREVLASAAAASPRMMRDVPQVESVTGAVYADDETPDLGGQLVEPPAWRPILEAFLRQGITDVAVLPPSRAVRNLLRDGLAALAFHAAEDDADLERIAEALPQNGKEAAAG